MPHRSRRTRSARRFGLLRTWKFLVELSTIAAAVMCLWELIR